MEQAHPQRRAARAVLDLQPSSSVAFTYHPLFGPDDDIMLLELDVKLLPDILHQRVVVRGQPDEDAVLCTQSKPYAIKFVGTSNSLFVIPLSDQPEFYDDVVDRNQKDQNQLPIASVIKVAPGTMEIIEVAPKLDKLNILLCKNPYRSEEDIETEGLEEAEIGLYKWDDLLT